MIGNLTDQDDGEVATIQPLRESELSTWLGQQDARVRAWTESNDFTAKPGSSCLISDDAGRLAHVLLGISDDNTPWEFGALPESLPNGTYALEHGGDADLANRAALGWGLGTYRFESYKKADPREAVLRWPNTCDRNTVARALEAIFLVRDLINTPTNDMGPEQLAAAAADLATEHDADITVIVGDDLLKKNYPAIHAVGRASDRAPRLIDLRWGDAAAPKVTLVGKGVCFDTGGLDLKAAAGMRLMKKDMGGAAHVLGIASMIMAAAVPVRLRVLIPAVENSVAGNAYRPSDVIPTRKGLTVEIGNTDAEGRVVLADALAEADTENPELLIDFATLTGAARVALGTELPALFSNSDNMADELVAAAGRVQDPMWRLPLWSGYRKMIDSKIADINNAPDAPQGGAITAALFLNEFVSAATPWAHFDVMAWNTTTKPGRPEGGEAMGIRAVYDMIAAKFGG